MSIFLSILMVALLVWMIFCERRQEREISNNWMRISFDGAVRAFWVRKLKHLSLERAIEKKHYEITAAMIKDEKMRSMGIPKWLVK